MEEARDRTFTRKKLKDNFIKDFSFSPAEECIKEAMEQINKFIDPKTNVRSTKDHRSNLICNNIPTNTIQMSTRLYLENDKTIGKRFRWRVDHPSTRKPMKSIMKVNIEQKIEPEIFTDQDFPPSFTEFKDGD